MIKKPHLCMAVSLVLWGLVPIWEVVIRCQLGLVKETLVGKLLEEFRKL